MIVLVELAVSTHTHIHSKQSVQHYSVHIRVQCTQWWSYEDSNHKQWCIPTSLSSSMQRWPLSKFNHVLINLSPSWMATLKNDLSLHKLTYEDAIEMALDKPLWGLLAASGATHWWCMPNNDDDDDATADLFTFWAYLHRTHISLWFSCYNQKR